MSAALLPVEVSPPFPPERCRGATCEHRDRYDVGTEEPMGPPCGRKATQIIFWSDRRYSPACGKHGLSSLDPGAMRHVLCVHPIEPPIVSPAGGAS